MDVGSGDKGDSESDDLDHRYYLWSDYNSSFEVVYLFHVKKSNIHTRKYSLINWFYYNSLYSSTTGSTTYRIQ